MRNIVSRWVRSTQLGSSIASLTAKPAEKEVFRFIVATRLSEDEFWRKSLSGKKLGLLKNRSNVVCNVAFSNRRSLAVVYNELIAAADEHDILVFMHDDVWLNDTDILAKIVLSLRRFDIVGVAGNTRRVPHQPAWIFRSYDGEKFEWDKGFLSGSIRCGDLRSSSVTAYGPSPASCELIDGVFIAARRRTLIASKVKFDDRFDFDFYDMDFCRSARRAGLSIGTWPFSIFHESLGQFGTENWKKNHRVYFDKWRK